MVLAREQSRQHGRRCLYSDTSEENWLQAPQVTAEHPSHLRQHSPGRRKPPLIFGSCLRVRSEGLLLRGEHDGFFPEEGGDSIRAWGRSQARMRQREDTTDGPREAEESTDPPPDSVMESVMPGK